MLLCLKYLGSTSLANWPWSSTWKLFPLGLQQMSASVSGSLTRVHSLVRKAGTLLGPAAPGPTGRSIPGETGEEEVATAKRGRGTG